MEVKRKRVRAAQKGFSLSEFLLAATLIGIATIFVSVSTGHVLRYELAGAAMNMGGTSAGALYTLIDKCTEAGVDDGDRVRDMGNYQNNATDYRNEQYACNN